MRQVLVYIAVLLAIITILFNFIIALKFTSLAVGFLLGIALTITLFKGRLLKRR